ncbi:alcohol dehydrogenase GroES-like domain-containing protein [Colletotrichum scovillei]|uniref:Alcohol dehydrogenase (Nadp+) n=1 Tax=Colletotrichum scovillei TaxID=1209932 RepID=A0A9P7R168_9PEZI|nr:alcohol dehydrogenase GroES-like domain-containing protein [Colletotrichum scovillei]KAF4781268.1 alcohol dehydrogenase GroES-like domain-containing protein [Colletotrichum scovillei]KAG7045318.1 alcohol dehydrogenase (nadp+) [Colletotrichum scovillei]KAG7052480.1 alcohol dehydrogenase (nadp+) [Colletotrichum scovillei]KAG7064770.1 alcohol dehydrogenase (nadp+) [Colletotrichum scovillei]
MSYPEKFTGFCTAGPSSWNKFTKETLTPKPFEDHDIDVQIECCGVCGSDVHTITGGWGEYEGPLCVGHEVVGKAVAVGKNVKEIKVGDRVGVGAQVWACLKCEQCKNQNENYCPHLVDTYNAKYEDGSQAHGGFASHIRAHEYFTFKIPDAIKSENAGPLMCAGLTTYSPLVRGGVGPGSVVAIVGIGGLGHLGLQWAKALGAEVYAVTHSPDKAEDCKKLGAKEVIDTNKKDWAKPYAFKFDFMLNCSDMTNEFDLQTYLSTLKVGGHFHMVGLPDKPLPQFPAGLFASNSAKMSGSHIGNNQEMNALLKLAAEKGISPWVETIDISEEGCKEAVERVKANKVHYRFTLVGHQKAFGTA